MPSVVEWINKPGVFSAMRVYDLQLNAMLQMKLANVIVREAVPQYRFHSCKQKCKSRHNYSVLLEVKTVITLGDSSLEGNTEEVLLGCWQPVSWSGCWLTWPYYYSICEIHWPVFNNLFNFIYIYYTSLKV